MVGVAEDDFGVDVVIEVAQLHALHASYGPDGHEDGRVDVAVVGMDDASAC